MSNNKLWEGSQSFKLNSHLHFYQKWLETKLNLSFNSYEDIWKWSVDNIPEFWKSIWDYFNVISYSNYKSVLTMTKMPDFTWFNGAKLNYSEHIFRHAQNNQPAIIFGNEQGDYLELTWDDLKNKVASMATYLKSIGVNKGDCVVAFLPNVPEATISFLAVNSIGAIWSSTSPDFGTESVIDRFAQIKPKVFITVDGYIYNGKPHDKTSIAVNIAKALPTLEQVIVLPYLNKKEVSKVFPNDFININTIFEAYSGTLVFEPVDFNHPIWVLYSSGTTGLPKAIVHSHGGILLEHLKYMAFHNDVHQGERYFWYTTTGWMMWNFLQSALLMGATIVLYDGSPTYPDFYKLWEFSDQVKINHFGTSAPFLVASMKNNISPKKYCNLNSIRSISSTGAPLPFEAFEYVYKNIKSDVWLCSMAGGTDVCTAFVGGTPYNAVYASEIQCKALGVSLYAFDDNGQPIEDDLGEMVIDKPMPSMPIYFWNDADNKRYKESYFEYYPGIWRHGDFIKINSKTHGIIIYGRSDATLNRHGIRIGTSEIYRSINKIDAIEDSLIVNLELEGGQHYMPLFVKMKSGYSLTNEVKYQINLQLKTEYSPRHVPDVIIEALDIPYTISGKKMEAPIKKILLKMPFEKSINIDSMKNPDSVNFFLEFAKTI